MPYQTCTVPAGEKVTIQGGTLTVPANPIIPFNPGSVVPSGEMMFRY